MTSDLREFDSYESAVRGFAWDIPSSYNVASDVSDRHSQSTAVAARCVSDRGIEIATFADLADASARLASSLAALGLGRNSRICMVMSDRLEALMTFLAIAKIGGVAITLRRHDSSEAFERELSTARPDATVCDEALAGLVRPLTLEKPFITARPDSWQRYQSGTLLGDVHDLADLIVSGAPGFETVETSGDDPLMVSFTSGSTGLAKGAVQPHRVARGALPAFQMATDLGPRPEDVFFINLGWSTMGPLRGIVLPAWQFAMPVVGMDASAPTIEDYCEVLTSQRVSVAYLMPFILKQLRQLGEDVHRFDWSALRVVITSGEPIGAGLQEWIESELGLALHAYYGQTEFASLVSTCNSWFSAGPGTIGRLVPGHSVRLVETAEVPSQSGSVGTMVIPKNDPGLFSGYLTSETTELPKGLADPYSTEDVARVDEEGYFYYLGREGAVISLPSGRIVAAADLEDLVTDIPGVVDVAVLGVQHEDSRRLVICVELDPGFAGDAEKVSRDVGKRLSDRLPADAHPDHVAVLRSFPKTKLTNKVNRRLLSTMVIEGDVLNLGVLVPSKQV